MATHFVYACTSTGILKVFPGRIIKDGFDPTAENWFIKAKLFDEIVLTRYVSGIGTLSKALWSEGMLKYVLAFDVPLNCSLLANQGPCNL